MEGGFALSPQSVADFRASHCPDAIYPPQILDATVLPMKRNFSPHLFQKAPSRKHGLGAFLRFFGMLAFLESE